LACELWTLKAGGESGRVHIVNDASRKVLHPMPGALILTRRLRSPCTPQ